MNAPKRLPARQAIIEAAFQVLGSDPTASLADIAEAAGVGRATLHRHFAGRSDLMQALVAQATRELDEATDAAAAEAVSHSDALEKVMAAAIALGDRQWFLAREQEAGHAEADEQTRKQAAEFRQLVEAARQEGLFPETCPTEWAMEAFDHLVYAAWILVRDGHATSKQAAALAWSTLTSGLRNTSL